MCHVIELTQSALREILREAKNVYIQGGASTPTYLLDMIGEMDIGGLSFYHIELGGDVFLFREDHTDRFRDYSFFVGANARDALQKGWTRYIPIFLSDIPWFLRTQIRLDLAIVNVSTPDSKGMMSLGPTVEAAKVAVEVARRTIAQVNGEVPRTFGGDSLITPGMVSHFLRHDEPPLHVTKRERPDEVDMKIGRNVAELIPDGATVQAGIGKVPDAVMLSLSDRRDLGVHTELISDGIVELMERGVVNNRLKAIDRYHTVGTFAKGERKVFDYLDDNTSVQMRSVEYTNDTSVIRRNRMMHSINSAVEVDLTGGAGVRRVHRAQGHIRGGRWPDGLCPWIVTFRGREINNSPEVHDQGREVEDRPVPDAGDWSYYDKKPRSVRGYRVRCCRTEGQDHSGKGHRDGFGGTPPQVQVRAGGGGIQDPQGLTSR